MRLRNAFYFLAVVLTVLCNNSGTFSKEIDVPSEPEQLRLFLLKGYTLAKSVIDDVRIEYEMTKIPVNPIPISPAVREKLKITGSVEETFTFVEEYIQKNGKERWVFLNFGKPAPTEDVSYSAELVKTENSPRFKVFDGQYILEYASSKDSFTNIGRGILEASNTGFFNLRSSGRCAPVQFFGYSPSLMPDDVLSSPQVEIEMKPEIIDGLLTYKVSAPFEEKHEKQNYKHEMTYWLSPERSCLPVKIEVWLNGKFKRRLETKEFIELEDGRWAIKSILQRNFLDRQGEGGLREIVNLLYSIRKIELYPEIDEDVVFDTSPDSLPEGAHIIDKRSGSSYDYINYPGPPGLIKKSLPELKDLGINLLLADMNDKSILVCFFDYEQIPSRKFIRQLCKKAKELQAKDIVIVAVQASKIDKNTLDEWIKDQHFPFPVGMIQGDEEKTRFSWGVKSLPRLILTDKKHIVQAEGFSVSELGDKIK